MLLEDPPDHILIDLETETIRNLLGDLKHPNFGLRRFISRTAVTSSCEGPLGPGFPRRLGV